MDKNQTLATMQTILSNLLLAARQHKIYSVLRLTGVCRYIFRGKTEQGAKTQRLFRHIFCANILFLRAALMQLWEGQPSASLPDRNKKKARKQPLCGQSSLLQMENGISPPHRDCYGHQTGSENPRGWSVALKTCIQGWAIEAMLGPWPVHNFGQSASKTLVRFTEGAA